MTTILIVEDNELNRDMLSRRLIKKGYSIEFAEDGVEGLEKLASVKPDLVLMDIGLPIMDGWEATKKAKENPDTEHIPIIALTAHALEQDRQKAFDGCSLSVRWIKLFPVAILVECGFSSGKGCNYPL